MLKKIISLTVLTLGVSFLGSQALAQNDTQDNQQLPQGAPQTGQGGLSN
jgi:hypothetical protein